MNIKKQLIIILSLVFLILIISFAIIVQNRDSINTVNFLIEAENGSTESVSVIDNNGTYYACLPSYAELKKTKISSGSANTISIDNNKNKKDFSCKDLIFDKEYLISIYGLFDCKLCERKIILKKASNIPAAFIQLSDGTIKNINSDKNISKSGVMEVINSNGEIDYSGVFKELHGRGNSSWLGNKKPYSIEFDEDTSLLNMNKGKKYNLIANSQDLRNKIALDLALDSKVNYPLNSEYLDLYVNGEYLGLYLLTESIEIGNERIKLSDLQSDTQTINRLPLKEYVQFNYTHKNQKIKGYNIPNSPKNISGGYLFEMDYPSRGMENSSVFITDSQVCYSLWSPKYASYKEVSYALYYMNQVNQNFKNDDIFKSVDFSSFVDFYLIQELLANTDDASFFFYKEKNNDILYAGPIWDFDLSMYESIYEIYVDPASSIKSISENTIFHNLCSNKEFMKVVKSRYKNFFYKKIEELYKNKINWYSKRIKQSYEMNYLRWNTDNKCSSDQMLEENKNSISNFLKKRNTAFKEKWIDKKRDCTIQLLSSDPVALRKYISVDYGKCIKEKELVAKGYKFLGYYNKQTKGLLDFKKPIHKDGTYVAKWEAINSTNKESVNTNISLREIIKHLISADAIVIIGVVIIGVFVILFVLLDIISKRRKEKGG